MRDFLKFFDTIADNFPMHMEITYSKITDYSIYIYKKGCAEDGYDLKIVYVQSCDIELCFAMAQVQLKEWLSENNGGY